MSPSAHRVLRSESAIHQAMECAPNAIPKSSQSEGFPRLLLLSISGAAAVPVPAGLPTAGCFCFLGFLMLQQLLLCLALESTGRSF